MFMYPCKLIVYVATFILVFIDFYVLRRPFETKCIYM